jgi:hypothetical protein
MFANAQLELACRMLEQMESVIELRLDPGPDPQDKFSRALCQVVEEICRAGRDKIQLVRVEPPRADRPLLTVANVRYRAVPFGPELEPFLELLVRLSRRQQDAAPGSTPSPDTGAPAETGAPAKDPGAPDPHPAAPGRHLTAGGPDTPPPDELPPARLQVMMAPTCPNCPRAVTAANRVAADHPAVELEVVDVQYFGDLAGSVRSVPTLIIDGTRTVVGGVGEQELLELLRERSSQSYVQRSLQSMLESGRMADVPPLLASAAGQQALCALLDGSTMQQRIGLMLAAEETLAANPHALDGSVPCLLPLLGSADSALRGDTADLLGRIGAPGARSALERLLEDPDADVREVAADALSMLREPS